MSARRTFLLLIAILVLSTPPLPAATAPMVLENAWIKITVDPASGGFSLAEKDGGRTVLADGQWASAAGPATLGPVHDPVFGDGQAVTFTGARIAVFRKLPFALITAVLKAPGTEPITVEKLPVFSATVAVPGDLRAMGTGGLQTPAKNTGSYAWLAIADPQTRSGIVGAWLTHDRGSGVVFSPATGGTVKIAAQVDYGRLRVKPGSAVDSETFALGYFPDARLGLEAYADAVAQHYAVKLPPRKSGFCTWYTEKHSRACDEKNLADLAAFAAQNLKTFGFDFVQIDDGWQQSGRVFEQENPKGPYPSGMKQTADAIAGLGLTPGLWFIPFAGDAKHACYADHQDRFYKDKAGKPFNARWGGTCLDMSVPETRQYLKTLIHRYSHEWGYKLFKMDGLWTGTGSRLMYVNKGYKWDELGEAAPADPDVTNVEAYRTGLKLVREAAGPDVFLLGCCVSQNMRSLGGSFGLVDAMRIGPDTGAGHIGAPHASRNYFLNGRVWWNDPDCVSVRAATPLERARVNASFTAVTGCLFYNSDWLPDLPAERLEILKRTLLGHTLAARPVDYFENDPASIWHLPGKDRDIVAFFNWGKSARTFDCPMERIGLSPVAEYVAFDFWRDQSLPPFHGTLKATLAAGSCRVLAVRPVAAHPQLLSTSRHVTQGLVDVIEEKWDEPTMTLSGSSRLVAKDPYELRVVVPVGENSWHAMAPARQEGPNVRLVLSEPAGGEMKWQIRFERGAVAAPAPWQTTWRRTHRQPTWPSSVRRRRPCRTSTSTASSRSRPPSAGANST